MIEMTATEASRSFKSVLDRAERGETIVVTRAGRRVAQIGPTTRANGAAVLELLARGAPDPYFARDIEEVMSLLTNEITTWPDD